MENKPDKMLRAKKIKLYLIESLLVSLIVLLGVVIYLLSYQRTYAGKIYPNIQFSDINIGGRSSHDATVLLNNYNKKLLLQKITIQSKDKAIEVTFADMGTSLDVDRIINDAYGVGRSNTFFKDVFSSIGTMYETHQLEPIVKTDQEKFSALIDKISADLAQKAVDAELKFEGSKITTTPSQKGLTVDRKELIEKISQAIEDHSIATITIEPTYSDPEIVEKDLEYAKNQAYTLYSKNLVIKAEEQVFNVNESQIAQWISFQKDPVRKVIAVTDNNKIATYVANSVAKKIDIAKVDRKILATTQVMISDGTNGRHLDRTDATNQLKNFVNGNQKNGEITLKVLPDVFGEQLIFPNEGVVPGRFPGKYIDVDLTNQQMYLFEGSNQIAQFTVSSGKWSMPTPTGTRYIINKDPRAWSAKYGLYMPYWQSIGEGYGIHELPEWPGGMKEGESHLGTPVSHGCIRLGIGSAQTVYNWTDIGTPVYIHK